MQTNINKLEGIVYKVMPYGETSKLLFVYTKIGKVTLHARGSQKLNSDLRILSQYLTKISFKPTNNKDFYNLSEAKLINEYTNIKNDYLKMKTVSLMLELINKSEIDNNYDERVYSLLDQSLNNEDILIASLSFALKFSYFLGIGPNLEADGRNVIGFNINSGRLVYEGENLTLDLNLSETLILLKLTLSKINTIEKINNNEIKVISNFIYYYYLDKLDLKLKALT